MRKLSLLSVLLITTSASAVYAQAATTLDEQMRRMQQGVADRKPFPAQTNTAPATSAAPATGEIVNNNEFVIEAPVRGRGAQAAPVQQAAPATNTQPAPAVKSAPVVKPAAPAVAAPAPAPVYSATAPVVSSSGLPVSRSGEVIDSVGNGAIPALPLEMVTENHVSYISGGISDEEIDQIKAQEGQYNIRLLITGANGEFASNVKLGLVDAGGKALVSVEDAGPYVYMKAPEGDYKLVANGREMPVSLKGGKVFKTQIRVAK